MARGNKNELVKCPYCGEMYSVTYKHCPFCNEDGTGRWDDPETDEEMDDMEEDTVKGGKRLLGGGGPSVRSIIWGILSLALILAAAGIVFSIIHSTLGERRAANQPAASQAPAVESAAPSAPESQAPVESVAPVTESTAPVDSAAPVESAAPVVSVAPQPQVTTPSVNLTAPTGFSLNREDFTFEKAGEVFDMKVKFTPADAVAEVQWKSSDPNIAAISWNGRVTAVSKGTVTLTATVPGVGEKTCICRCNFTGTSPAPTKAPASSSTTTTTTTTTTSTSSTTSSSASSSSGLKLNREDITMKLNETFRMVVSGTSSAVTWASSNTNVATIGADGTVKAVGKGTCNVTATVDGKTLKCIIRCSG